MAVMFASRVTVHRQACKQFLACQDTSAAMNLRNDCDVCFGLTLALVGS